MGKEGCSCALRLEEPIEGLLLAAQSIERTSNNLLSRRKELLDIQPLTDSVRGAVKLIQKSFPERKIHLDCNNESTSPHIIGLSRIVSNLIKNSIEASSLNSPILVSLKKTGESFTLKIKDCGSRIPRTILNKIESGEVMTTKQHGNGLGLSSMIEWTKKHGVQYSISSILNEGTEISLIFAGTTT